MHPHCMVFTHSTCITGPTALSIPFSTFHMFIPPLLSPRLLPFHMSHFTLRVAVGSVWETLTLSATTELGVVLID